MRTVTDRGKQDGDGNEDLLVLHLFGKCSCKQKPTVYYVTFFIQTLITTKRVLGDYFDRNNCVYQS